MGRIPPKLKHIAEMHITEAPHCLPLREGDDVPTRTWFELDSQGKWTKSSYDATIQHIQSVWEQQGPFDGLFGFSQGGTLAAVLAAMSESHFPSLKFVICFGAPDVQTLPNGISCTIASLHGMGKTDLIVSREKSMSLANRFTNPVCFEHELGHCLPKKAEHIQMINDFITSTMSKFAGNGNIDSPPTTITSNFSSNANMKSVAEVAEVADNVLYCASESCAEQQQEEIDTLLAIFSPTEISILSPTDTTASTGRPTGKLIIYLQPPSDQPALAWASKLSLLFHMTANYPDSSLLKVEIQTNGLSMLQFTTSMRKSLLSALVQSVFLLFPS